MIIVAYNIQTNHKKFSSHSIEIRRQGSECDISFHDFVAALLYRLALKSQLGNGMIVVVVFGRFNIFVTDGNGNRFPIMSVHEKVLRVDGGHAMRKRMFS